MKLFDRAHRCGVFKGLIEGRGLEFHADLALPYREELQSIPMHGQFLLVQLENEEEAILGRISSFVPQGKLSFGSGEEFTIRAMQEDRQIPEDLREQYLKYRINIRVLGILRMRDGQPEFIASHRRLPHVGAPVSFPSVEMLRELSGHNLAGGAHIGQLAFGEYVYDKPENLSSEYVAMPAPVDVRFEISNLVSRRTNIFARAGFGKSNLNKLLFAELYKNTPTTRKRGGVEIPVGTVIFDPDGEYFWPDDKGRPGLCDVPELEDKPVVFTDRMAPSDFYQSFVAGTIRLDIRTLKPSDVIGIALDPERQNQQNVRKLRGLSSSNWEKLVDLINVHGYSADDSEVARLLGMGDAKSNEAEIAAAKSNMTTVVRMLHDPASNFLHHLERALSDGKLCVVDISGMRGSQGLVLSGLILRRIFDRNQQEFTKKDPKTIPTIAVIEEAQSVLGERGSASEPYVAWVKEGRKYDLGALLVTQQPGSIPSEILSQGDNWFVFHLLSEGDLRTLKGANANFSDDILSSLLNEPMPGHGVFWSSANRKPFPVSLRVRSFEQLYAVRDPQYTSGRASTYASTVLADIMRQEREQAIQAGLDPDATGADATNARDALRAIIVQVVSGREDVAAKLKAESGAPWGFIMSALESEAKSQGRDLDAADLRTVMNDMVIEVATRVLGRQNEYWRTERRPKSSGEGQATWIVKIG